MPDLIADLIAQFKDAAGEAAVLELKTRILADKVPALEKHAHERLEHVEDAILRHFAAKLTPDESTMLSSCRRLRNKLFHCDFRPARDKLHALGVPPQTANVQKIDLRGLDTQGMLDKIAAAAAKTPGSFQYVAQTSTKDGGIFGWLLELGGAGDFLYAISAFRRANSILDRLFVIADQMP